MAFIPVKKRLLVEKMFTIYREKIFKEAKFHLKANDSDNVMIVRWAFISRCESLKVSALLNALYDPKF